MDTNFRTIHPIDFQLIDKDSQNVLYIEDSSDQTLTLKLTNNSPNTIEFEDVTEEQFHAGHYHFALRFRPGTLSPTSLDVGNEDTVIQLADSSATVWEMAPPEQDAAGRDVLYLKKRFNTSEPWQSGTPQTVVFKHVGADARQGARGTRVELLTQHIYFSDDTENYLKTQREIHLSVVNHRGKKNIPLHIGFMSDNGVLNDNSPNTLRIRCSNTLPFDAANPDVSGLRFLHNEDETQRSKIIFSFDTGTIDQEGALGKENDIEDICIKQPAGWSIDKENQGTSPEWILYPTEDHILYGKDTNAPKFDATFPFLFEELFLDLTISNIITDFPTGHTHLYIRYENIPGYWDGQLTLPIEKRPLVYHSKNVGIGTNNPQSKLDVEGSVTIGATYSGTNAAPANGLLVEGNVGIGTSNPQSKLDVEGGVAIGAAYSGTNPAPTNGLLVEGNVGIGTNNPQSKLDVEGGVTIGAAYSGTNAAPANGLLVEGNVGIGVTDPRIHLAIGDNDTGLKQQGDGELAIYTNNNERLRVNSNGNVGIGTTNPSAKLEVNGNLKVNGTFSGSGADEFLKKSNLTCTHGEVDMQNRASKVDSDYFNSWDINYYDVSPPTGYSIDDLVGFTASSAFYQFSGYVDFNDKVWCRYLVDYNNTGKIRIIHAPSENTQEASLTANYLAIWKK